MFDAIEFHKMRKFLASKLRTIVQCTGNPYLANCSRKMALLCRKRNQRELGTKDYSAITKVLEEPLQMVF